MKKLLSLIVAATMFFSMLTACATPEQTSNPTTAVTETATEPAVTEPAATEPVVTEPEKVTLTAAKEMVRYYLDVPVSGSIAVNSAPIAPLNISRKVPTIQSQDGIEPYSAYWWGDTQVTADLSDNPLLAYNLTISSQTTFEEMPEGYDQDALLEWGKYPGLNIDILHKHGFTGKGAVVAYVDQPISDHPAYANVNLHYTNNTDSDDSMHGPAVLSLLAGQEIGTAPEAEVYFYGHAAWQADQTTHAECLYQIIEQNKTLPEGEKITMVGFSDNPDPYEQNFDAFQAAVKACEEAGIMVWFCAEYGAATFLPMSNKNDPNNLVKANWWGSGSAQLVFVPESGRTTANMNQLYTYWAQGGLSWTMPYVLGLYGIAKEIDPSLTQDDLRDLIVETAYNTNGMKLINPVGFVAKTLQNVGRAEEAQAMLDEVEARTKYLYAVMNTSAMSTADLDAVRDYLATMTDVSVLIVDTAFFQSAEQLYTALQQDAKERGGEVAGVQIFGTPDLVPAFSLQYKVQMADNVDDAGTFLSDLFYGNFSNDPARIANGYNVMDHFAQGWDVDLIPQWPVARLPLGKGEFAAFFGKYSSFLDTTGLQQPDLVNFSNPIFPNPNHTDDMSTFLNRMNEEFDLLEIPYRLYGNNLGQYPVKTATIGGFTAEELAAENAAGIAEFLINSHGQWNNIDKCYFEGNQEKRASLINMDTINQALCENPYYLDAWTCNNGYNMNENLTTTALSGNCVGMFSATHIISNNGVNCRASVSDMAKSNFYYFYYHYLKSLHEGKTRGTAFFTAQQQYAAALIADSANGIRNGEGNYQFNLCNLLVYHNFGVLEPGFAAEPFATVDVIALTEQMAETAADSASQPHNKQNSSIGTATVSVPEIAWYSNELNNAELNVHSITSQKLDNGHTRFFLEFTATQNLRICVFSPGNDERVKIFLDNTTGIKEQRHFDIPTETLQTLTEGILAVNFLRGDDDRCFVFFYPVDAPPATTAQIAAAEATVETGATVEAEATVEAAPVPIQEQNKQNIISETATATASVPEIAWYINELHDADIELFSITAQKLDTGSTRFFLDFHVTSDLRICVFSPDNELAVKMFLPNTTGVREQRQFDIADETLQTLPSGLAVNFHRNDGDRCFVLFDPADVPAPSAQTEEIITNNELKIGPKKATVSVPDFANYFNELRNAELNVHSITAQKLDNGYTRFFLEFTATPDLQICAFAPMHEDTVKFMLDNTTGKREQRYFDISDKILSTLTELTINFLRHEGDRCFVFFNPAEVLQSQ